MFVKFGCVEDKALLIRIPNWVKGRVQNGINLAIGPQAHRATARHPEWTLVCLHSISKAIVL